MFQTHTWKTFQAAIYCSAGPHHQSWQASILQVSIAATPQLTKAIISHIKINFCTNSNHLHSQNRFFLQKSIIISCPIHSGDGEWLIPFGFATVFYILENMSPFSLAQLFPFFFVKLLHLYHSSLSFSVESPLLSVSVLSCSVQTTPLQLRLAQELTEVTSCIWQGALLWLSLSQPHQDPTPRVLMAILCSHGKTRKFATLDKLNRSQSTGSPLLWTWYPSVLAFPPAEHNRQTSSIIFRVFLPFFNIILGFHFHPPTHPNFLLDVLQI